MNITSAQMADLLNMTQVEKMKGAKEEDGTLRKACTDFEGVLLNYMFQSMKKTVGDSGLFGDSFQRDMYDSLYIEKISEKIAEERDMGLGASLYRQLAARMEGASGGGESGTPASGQEKETRTAVSEADGRTLAQANETPGR